MLSLTSFAAEMERERAKQRTHDAMLRKAQAGHVVGGKIYGYDNVDILGPVGHDGKVHRQYVARQINEREAQTVRRIFEMHADGFGLTRIAKTLNVEHVMPPRRGPNGWGAERLA